jgi:hypothetical protein
VLDATIAWVAVAGVLCVTIVMVMGVPGACVGGAMLMQRAKADGDRCKGPHRHDGKQQHDDERFQRPTHRAMLAHAFARSAVLKAIEYRAFRPAVPVAMAHEVFQRDHHASQFGNLALQFVNVTARNALHSRART